MSVLQNQSDKYLWTYRYTVLYWVTTAIHLNIYESQLSRGLWRSTFQQCLILRSYRTLLQKCVRPDGSCDPVGLQCFYSTVVCWNSAQKRNIKCQRKCEEAKRLQHRKSTCSHSADAQRSKYSKSSVSECLYDELVTSAQLKRVCCELSKQRYFHVYYI